jgi:hypothetical protein
MAQKEKSIASLSEGILSAKMCLCARRSAQNKCIVEVQ